MKKNKLHLLSRIPLFSELSKEEMEYHESKFIVKKYLGRSVYKGQTKVIAINKDVFEVLFSEAKL